MFSYLALAYSALFKTMMSVTRDTMLIVYPKRKPVYFFRSEIYSRQRGPNTFAERVRKSSTENLLCGLRYEKHFSAWGSCILYCFIIYIQFCFQWLRIFSFFSPTILSSPQGLCVPLHHQYVGEISPKKLRGFANSTSSFFWCLGKAIGQISGQR